MPNMPRTKKHYSEEAIQKMLKEVPQLHNSDIAVVSKILDSATFETLNILATTIRKISQGTNLLI